MFKQSDVRCDIFNYHVGECEVRCQVLASLRQLVGEDDTMGHQECCDFNVLHLGFRALVCGGR